MSVSFTFKKIVSTEALKTRVQKRVEKFDKFVNYSMDVHVMMSLERTLHTCEVTCHAEHRELVAMAKSSDLYESIDEACHKIEAQLKKEREKRKGHQAAHASARSSSLKQAVDLEAEVPHLAKKRVRATR